VIAGGRLLLSCLFLIATMTDPSQATGKHLATYVLLGGYVLWSLSITLIIWNNWWQDARLAAPAHVIDVAVFMFLLYSTAGYASPYFTFFIFILLAAAIRWGWKETSVTAVAIIAVYISAGFLLPINPRLEIQPFIVRTGHLIIISAILIWFGANQWVPWRRLGPRPGPAGDSQGDAFIAALQKGMAAVGARRAAMVWRDAADDDMGVVTITPAGTSRSLAPAGTMLPDLAGNLLFDRRRDRVLMRAEAGRWQFLRAAEALPERFPAGLDAEHGLAIPIATGAAEGLAVFHDVVALSTDHLDVAPRVARDLAVRIQEAAMFAAVEEHSMARARVAVARDLHDSVVQFLAGLGFRLEALKRSPAVAGELAASLEDLKDTVMAEQRHLRAFIRGLRTGKPISLHDLSRDCAALCQLLARQWNIACTCEAKVGSSWIPLRTQLDVQHLVREAVANAVRHGEATRVTVSMASEQEELRVTVADNGKGFALPATAGEHAHPPLPASLAARVREARGKLEVRTRAGDTAIVFRLPVDGAS
jgi:signal transduction histidine kinase